MTKFVQIACNNISVYALDNNGVIYERVLTSDEWLLLPLHPNEPTLAQVSAFLEEIQLQADFMRRDLDKLDDFSAERSRLCSLADRIKEFLSNMT